jgi:acetylornithine deacetylase/succinyl-diaminopimelate desuccinylase-like protein
MLSKIKEYVSREDFRRRLIDCLTDICSIDTSPNPDPGLMRQAEHRVLERVEKELRELKHLHGRLQNSAIPASIEGHPAFSNPFYAYSGSSPKRRSTAEIYRNRHNLLYRVDNEPSPGGTDVALNAHIDVVPPFYPPKLEGQYLYGRGTADDKGNVAAIIGTLSVLNSLVQHDGLALRGDITAMFVIDEEMGGNGSLALCLDSEIMERCETMLVLECTGNRLHTANRGAVHLACAVQLDQGRNLDGRISTIESLVYAILELEREGDLIKKESDHPLFPHRPVQTCTGIIGPFGDHPSTLCGAMSFRLTGLGSGGSATRSVAAVLRKGLAAYTAKYGDKTRVRDAATGRRKIDHHLSLEAAGDGGITVTVHGSSGHMGSLPQNDSAIMKWAYMARELIEGKRRGELCFDMHLGELGPGDAVLFEGAQGFLPTHGIGEIMARATAALRRGVGTYLRLLNADQQAISCKVSFEKLHNDAFASEIRPETMKRLRQAAAETGLLQHDQPLVGWDVSCDARLFANERPGRSVITCGVGSLEFAHSGKERIHLPELFQLIEFLTYFLIRETGSTTS